MSKISNACDISPKVRQEVLERDNGCCIVCGSNYCIEIAHYISRARLGLGIPENLACLCHDCHFNYDNGNYHRQTQNAFETYLKAHYQNWDKDKLTYKKYGR